MKPAALPYDFDEWKQLPFSERAKKVCQAWALQGFGAPTFAIVFYVVKIALYVWIWTYFCSFSKELGNVNEIHLWWFNIEALGKALLVTLLFEITGLGGGSGPLTARYIPPIGGITYYLRPGTIKTPLFPNLPILGNDKRNLFDIFLYAALLFFIVKASVGAELTPIVILPIIILLPILGILDRQLYLVARADVWYPCLFVFLFPSQTANALKIAWFAIWFWAAFSKLTPSFTSVVSVMICNSPIFKFQWLRKLLFKNYPDDLRLSNSVTYIAHFGTLVEFVLPISLLVGTLLGWDYQTMFYLLIGMTAFHTFIFLNLPMGVPMEWNIIMVYGGWLLFGFNPESSPLLLTNLPIISLFLLVFLLLPLAGNFFPKYVSFLLSMRYYAGTWAYTIWLFKDGKKMEKLEPNIVKTSPDLRKQLAMFYDEKTVYSILSRVIAFRLMHLPGRALHDILPKAVENIDDYYWQDGEFIAGEIGGWNFGDGHLSHKLMLNSVQKRCNFDSEELRVIMVESPQMLTGKIHWQIHDAKDGLIEEGHTFIKDLKSKMPWPT